MFIVSFMLAGPRKRKAEAKLRPKAPKVLKGLGGNLSGSLFVSCVVVIIGVRWASVLQSSARLWRRAVDTIPRMSVADSLLPGGFAACDFGLCQAAGLRRESR